MVLPLGNWGKSSKLICEEAEKLGLKVEILIKEKNLFSITGNGKKILFKNVDSGLNSSLGYKISDDKHLTYTLCEKIGIPTPETLYLETGDEEEIDKVIKRIGFPLVTKPYDGAHGDGVSINITSKELLKKGYDFAKKYTSGKIVVQKEIEGLDNRILILGNDVIAGAIRLPPYVIGDGIHTIGELVDKENNNSERGEWNHHDSIRSKIRIDSEFYETLEKKGLSLSSIIEKNKKIFVRRNCNLSTGGFSINITHLIHEDTKKACIDLLQAIGLRFAAVDIMTTDISKPLSKTGGKVIEINATPGINMHHHPSEGDSINVANKLLKHLFF